jgi:hypothetical protein
VLQQQQESTLPSRWTTAVTPRRQASEAKTSREIAQAENARRKFKKQAMNGGVLI